MKRTFVAACLLSAVVAAMPARADVIVGSIDAPVAHPAIPRMLYNASAKLNGVMGYVAEFDATTAERPFELRRLNGASGREDLDVWFYRDIAGTGDPCPRILDQEGSGGESGTICSGAGFAVVVLFAGMDADFQLIVG